MRPNIKSTLSLVLGAIALAAPASVIAQTTTANPASSQDTTTPSASQEQPIQLSSFNVESTKDYGYRDANSITATGMATPILDTPVMISVMTDQYLSDTASFQIVDALNTLPGVETAARQDVPFPTIVRGFTVAPQINGYDLYALNQGGSGASFGIERVEVIEGPSAVFNGDIPPGGVVNVIYKTPSFTPSSYIEGMYGSWDYQSVEVFATGPLIPNKLSYLVDAYGRNSNAWTDYTNTNEKSIILGVTYKPFDAVTLTVNYRNFDRSAQVYGAIAETHQGFQTSGLPWNTNIATWVQQTYGFNSPTFTEDVAPSYYPGGYKYNGNGPQNFQRNPARTFNPELTIKVNDHLELRSGFQYFSETYAALGDVGGIYDVGPGPQGELGVDAGAYYYTSEESAIEFKEEAALHFDTGPVNHSLLVGFQYENAHGLSSFAEKTLQQPYNYYTDGPSMLRTQLDSAYPDESYLTLGNPYDAGRVYGYYVAEQASAFDGRVHVLLGARYTEEASSITTSKTTPEFGLLFKPFPKGSILQNTSIFANYSESFTPSGAVDAYGHDVPPQLVTGREIGIKTDWFDGRLSGTLSFFRDNLANIAEEDFILEQQTGKSPLYDLGADEISEGAELDLVWTPTRNFQIGFNDTYLPDCKTVAFPSVPQQVGVRLPLVPVERANLYGKYTFTTGSFKGLYVGGGLVGQTTDQGVYVGEWNFGVHMPGFVMGQAFLGYQTVVFGRKVDYKVNIHNLFDRSGFSWDPTVPQDPTSFYFTVRVSL